MPDETRRFVREITRAEMNASPEQEAMIKACRTALRQVAANPEADVLRQVETAFTPIQFSDADLKSRVTRLCQKAYLVCAGKEEENVPEIDALSQDNGIEYDFYDMATTVFSMKPYTLNVVEDGENVQVAIDGEINSYNEQRFEADFKRVFDEHQGCTQIAVDLQKYMLSDTVGPMPLYLLYRKAYKRQIRMTFLNVPKMLKGFLRFY
jgi:anti-anti-sigma regulatory factor